MPGTGVRPPPQKLHVIWAVSLAEVHLPVPTFQGNAKERMAYIYESFA